ncbi:hypothetical protein NC652_005578 [Populus alba x Populus x berolinensis]|nr:hypothetical protein NC652_005578 [Populus alba x Populus x berolinensis]
MAAFFSSCHPPLSDILECYPLLNFLHRQAQQVGHERH